MKQILWLLCISVSMNTLCMKQESAWKKALVDLALDTINTQDSFGNTSLHYAVLLNDIDEVRDELNVGNNPNISNNNNETPVHLACKQQPLNTSIINLLLSGNADLNAQDNMGNTPVHFFIDNTNKKIKELNLLRNMLSMYKGSPNIQNKQGFTPLHRAIAKANAKKGDLSLIRVVINRGANPLIKFNDIKTRQGKVVSVGKSSIELAESIRNTHKKNSRRWKWWNTVITDLKNAAEKLKKPEPKSIQKSPLIKHSTLGKK